MTSALMSYLSAVECATATEGHHETCKECGAVIYKIANRVRNLSAEFLGDDLGKVFHKLYSYRSKFLHTGRMASDANIVRTIPLLSEFSETGVKEFGNVAIKVSVLMNIFFICSPPSGLTAVILNGKSANENSRLSLKTFANEFLPRMRF